MDRSVKLVLAVIAVVVLSTSGCDDTTIDPFDNDERYFTVYGYLDELKTRHELRVVPVSRFAENILAESESQGTIDAKVFTTDMSTGRRIEWQHTFSPLNDGTYGHVFHAEFLASAGREYKLEVIRSDGKMASAVTKVPKINEAYHFERGSEVYKNDSTLVYLDVSIPDISSPWEVQAIYFWGTGLVDQRLLIPYGRPGHRLEGGGWTMRMNISEDQAEVEKDVEWSRTVGILAPGDPWGLNSIGFQIRVLDDNWDPPGGVFDPEVLAQPGAMSNIVNGYGFFGSIGLYTEEWNAEHLSLFFGHPW